VITDKLDISRATLAVKNASKHDDYKKYYDESLYRSVSELYKDDLELFDYAF
jgi:hypothetical protein